MPTKIIVFLLAQAWLILPTKSLYGEATRSDPLAPAWQAAATFMFKDAHRQFIEAAGEEGVGESERQLGEALALLNLQPRTQGNIRRAAELFGRVAEADAHGTSGLSARYYLARIWEQHASPPDPARAAQLYRKLLVDGRGHLLPELAASRLVNMELFATGSREELDAREHELAPLGELLRHPVSRREFYHNLGSSLLLLDGDRERAVGYLELANDAGYTRTASESGALISIAEAALALGDEETARTYYAKFVERYPRNFRSYHARQQLARLQASGPIQPEDGTDP